MPKRPPKKWWKRCVAGVESKGGAIDPAKICGALWFRKMSKADKKIILALAERAQKGRKTK